MAIKRITAIMLISVLMFVSSGCSYQKGKLNDEWEQFGSNAVRKVGLVITEGEKGPGSADPIVAAVKKSSAEQGVNYRILNPGDLANDKESLTYLAENQFNLIIAYGKGIEKALSQVASEYPDEKFAIVGGEVDKPNVTSIKIDQSEGAFLAGVAAGALTKSGIVGFLGGTQASDGALATGFARGVYFTNLVEGKKTKVNTIYAGVTSQAAEDPGRGYNLANTLYWSGVDVVFCTTGNMDNGVVRSAIENRKVVVVSDVKLMTQYPWNVYASLTDKSENAAYDLVKKALAGKISSGKAGYGVAEGALDLLTSEAMPQEIKNRLQDVKNKLKNGQIKPYALNLPSDMVSEINQLPVDLGKQPLGQNGSGQNGSGQNGSGQNGSGQNESSQSGSGQSGSGSNSNNPISRQGTNVSPNNAGQTSSNSSQTNNNTVKTNTNTEKTGAGQAQTNSNPTQGGSVTGSSQTASGVSSR